MVDLADKQLQRISSCLSTFNTTKLTFEPALDRIHRGQHGANVVAHCQETACDGKEGKNKISNELRVHHNENQISMITSQTVNNLSFCGVLQNYNNLLQYLELNITKLPATHNTTYMTTQ